MGLNKKRFFQFRLPFQPKARDPAYCSQPDTLDAGGSEALEIFEETAIMTSSIFLCKFHLRSAS